MRKREKPAQLDEHSVPAALLVGPCIEVWAAEQESSQAQAWHAHRGHSTARRAWLDAHDVPTRQRLTPVPFSGPPWSVAYLDEQGRSDRATRLLSEGGVTRRDLPALRQQARELLDAASQVGGRS